MTGFGLDNLPLGVFSVAGGARRIGAAFEGSVIDLHAALGDPVYAEPTLNAFMARGPQFWKQARAAIAEAARNGAHAVPRAEAELHLPFAPADFIDFFSSLEHATNAGNILRPANPGLPASWRDMPIGYHGRAGTVVVSGTPIVRPTGQIRQGDGLAFLPSAKLDVEVELGFVVGVPSRLGEPVAIGEFEDHVFGAVILLDWSARDIQSVEYQPLGPFLGKSFGTTISPWVVPLASLEAARVPGPVREPEPMEHLREARSWSLDIQLELRVNGQLAAAPSFGSMYWTAAQQLAHLTSNGASLRTGDLYGTGTISSFDREAQGSLLELSTDGTAPMTLPDGQQLGYLKDGDVVSVSAFARTGGGGRIDFGEATGQIVARKTKR